MYIHILYAIKVCTKAVMRKVHGKYHYNITANNISSHHDADTNVMSIINNL